MDDPEDAAIDRLSAVDLIVLTQAMKLAYRAGCFETLDLPTPLIKSAKLRSLLRHVRAEHWRDIEVARAMAAAEESEPPAPLWLAELQRQRPPPAEGEPER